MLKKVGYFFAGVGLVNAVAYRPLQTYLQRSSDKLQKLVDVQKSHVSTNQFKKEIDRVKIQSILNYWFGENVDRNQAASKEAFKKWFMSTPDIDNEIRERFLDDINKLASGQYEEWKQDKEGRLAAVILTDQFTRNIFRRKKEAFAYDHIALDIVKKIPVSEIETYAAQEQSFLLLPFEHSENLEDQATAVKIAENLVNKNQDNEQLLGFLKQVHLYAVKHQVVIQKFGRFPHRNEILGRESTPEEVEYLITGEKFGQ